VSGHRRHRMRGALLWQRRGTWSRRICWRAARSASWRRPTESIAAGSTSLLARYREGALQSQQSSRRGSAGNRVPARAAALPGTRLRGEDDRLPPRPPGDGSRSFDLDDLADPEARGPHHAAAAKAPAQLADPLRGRSAQRDVAGRHHALDPGRRRGGGDPQHARRPLPPVLGLGRLPDLQGGRCRRGISIGGRPARRARFAALRQRRRVHREAAWGAKCSCRSRWSAWG
jgi:hypothetical protein